MSKAILFVRVSTLQQHLESQEDALRKAALSDGYSGDDIIVIGKKESAIKLEEDEREGLVELKETLQTNDIECVYIFELSRLSRKPKILYSIREQLHDAHVQLKCLNPSFSLLNRERTDYDNTASIIFSLFGALTEQEMIEKKERFHRGKMRLALEGRYNGGNIPFGYRIDRERNNLIVIDEDDSAIVKAVFSLYEGGMSQRKIAAEFQSRGYKNLTMSFVNNILTNARYTGNARCYPGSSFTRTYPVIISPEQFDRCREIAKQNSTTADKTRNIYYAQNLIYCLSCGCKWSSSGSKVVYHCYDACNPNRKLENYKTPQCTNKIGISINIMDSLLWHIAKKTELRYILNSASEDKHLYEERLSVIEQKINFVSERLQELDEKKARIVESYIDGYLSKEKRDKRFEDIEADRRGILLDQVRFEEEKTHLEGLLNDLNNLYNLDTVEGIVDQIERNLELQNRIEAISDDEERSRIVHRHIKRVTVQNRQVEYEFGIGKRKALSRFISIELYIGESQYYHFIPNSGNGGIIITSDENEELVEKLDFDYLDRYYDEGKRRRSIEAREKNKNERDTLYPKEKYALGFGELAEWLHVCRSTAFRWIEKDSILRPAVKGKYKKMNIIDKEECLNILRREATNNAWIAKILKGMDI